jgi:hypothetical protein
MDMLYQTADASMVVRSEHELLNNPLSAAKNVAVNEMVASFQAFIGLTGAGGRANGVLDSSASALNLLKNRDAGPLKDYSCAK